MFRLPLLFMCAALCCGRQDHDDWTDPTDMFNYDAATGKMIKQKHNTEEKVEGVCEKAGEDPCPGNNKAFVTDIEKPKQVNEEHKLKEVLKSPDSYSNPVFRRFLRKVLNEAERLGLPEDSSSEVYYNAEMVLTKQMVAEIQKFIDDEDWNLGALEEALVRTLVQFRYHNVKEWWAAIFEDYIGMDIGTTLRILLCITCIVMLIATELWSRIGWFTQLKRLCILSFFISVGWNWMYLYKVAFAERQAELAKMQMFDSSCGEKMSWSESLIEWWRGAATFQNDPCEEYFKSLMINPVLMVPPTKALALTFTDFITEPLKHVGKAMGEFLNGLLAEVPVVYQLLVLILIAAIIMVSCYGASKTVGHVLTHRNDRQPNLERLPPAEPSRERLPPAEPTRERLPPAEPSWKRLPPAETDWERLPPAEPLRPHYGNVIGVHRQYYIEPPYAPIYRYGPNQRLENLQAIDVPYDESHRRPPGLTETDFPLRPQDGGGERRKEEVAKLKPPGEQSGKTAEESSAKKQERKEEPEERPDSPRQRGNEPITESSFSEMQNKEEPAEQKSTEYQRKADSREETNNSKQQSKTEPIHSKSQIEEEHVDQNAYGQRPRGEEPPHERRAAPVEEISHGEPSWDKSLEKTGRNEEVTKQKPLREQSEKTAEPTKESSEGKQRQKEPEERPDGPRQRQNDPIGEGSFTEMQEKDHPGQESTEYQRNADSIEETHNSTQQSKTESLHGKAQMEEEHVDQNTYGECPRGEEPPHERSSGPQQRREASVEEISHGEPSWDEGGAPDDKSLEQTGALSRNSSEQKIHREEAAEDKYLLAEEMDEYEYEYEYEYDISEEDEEEESSYESEEEPVIKEESAKMRALRERLRKKAEEAGYLDLQSFQDDPRWPSLEDVPKDDNYDHPRIGNTSWCGCHNCKPMKTRDESNCCVEEPALKPYFDQGLTCILEHDELKELRFDERNLELMVEFSGWGSAREIMKDRNRVIRKAAYRSYSCFVHGISGPSKWKPIPSCVVHYIRGAFPDPEGETASIFKPADYAAPAMAYDV